MSKLEISAEVLHGVLDGEIRRIKPRVDWARWLDAVARFPTYDFGNAVLIALQEPAASWVAGSRTWRRMGRGVMKNNAIRILSPVGVGVAEVWDVTHTVGPRPPVPPGVSGKVEDLWSALVRDARANGFNVVRGRTSEQIPSYSDSAERVVVISDQLDALSTTARLAHEVGHIRLHSATESFGRCTGISEIEAESFAHVAVTQYGLPFRTESFARIARLTAGAEAQNPVAAIKAMGDRVASAARPLLTSRLLRSSAEHRQHGSLTSEIVWTSSRLSGLEL